MTDRKNTAWSHKYDDEWMKEAKKDACDTIALLTEHNINYVRVIKGTKTMKRGEMINLKWWSPVERVQLQGMITVNIITGNHVGNSRLSESPIQALV